MDKGRVLMMGNRLKGVAWLMRAGQHETAAAKMERVTSGIPSIVVKHYKAAIETAWGFFEAGDAEMVDIVGQGIIDSLLKQRQ